MHWAHHIISTASFCLIFSATSIPRYSDLHHFLSVLLVNIQIFLFFLLQFLFVCFLVFLFVCLFVKCLSQFVCERPDYLSYHIHPLVIYVNLPTFFKGIFVSTFDRCNMRRCCTNARTQEANAPVYQVSKPVVALTICICIWTCICNCICICMCTYTYLYL